jgi:Holliday junction resolvase RusA-like endonuclease
MRSIEFTVLGFPAPKGSMRAAGNRVIPSGNKANCDSLVSWESAVRQAATAALRVTPDPVLEVPLPGVIMFVKVPLRFTAVWRMPRLMAHFHKTGPKVGSLRDDAPRYPVAKPDADKLLRTTWDALTMLVFDDDSRIAETMMRKIYAPPGQEGAWIKIEQLEDK